MLGDHLRGVLYPPPDPDHFRVGARWSEKNGYSGDNKRESVSIPETPSFLFIPETPSFLFIFFCIEGYALETADSSVKRGLISKGVVDKQAGVLKGTESPFIPKKSDCY